MATEVKKGITIEFRGDTVQFDNSMDNINRALKLLQAENARLNRALKFDSTNVDLLEEKFKNLQTAERLATERLNNYKVALIDTIDKNAEITKSDKWKDLANKIKGCEDKATEYAKQLGEIQEENGHITDLTRWKELRGEQAQNAEQLYSLYDQMIKLAQSNDAITDVEKWMNLTTQMVKAESEIVNLEAQTDKASQQMAILAGKDVATNLEQIKNKAYEVGSAFTALGNSLKPISTFAQTALVKTTEKAVGFEEAFAGVKKTVEATPEVLAEVAKEFRELSKEIPVTTTEISKVGEMAGQLGVEATNLSEFTKVMIKLGSSTNLSAEEASTAIARIFNVVSGNVNDNIEDVGRFGSALVALGNKAAATESEILEMTTRLASAGSIYNVTEADLLGLATAMSAVGLKAEGGGSSIATIMNNIEKLVAKNKWSEKLYNFAKISNMTVSQFKQAWRDDALGTLTAVIHGLDSTDASATKLLEDMGITSIRQTDTMLRLISAVDMLDEYVGLSNEAWDLNRALTDEASKRYQTMQSKITLLKNAFEDFMVTIGDKITPILSPFIDKLTKFINELNAKPDFINNLTLGLTALVASLAPMASTIGVVSTKFGGFLDKIIKSDTDVKKVSVSFGDIATKIGQVAKAPYDRINNSMLGMFGKIVDGLTRTKSATDEAKEANVSFGGKLLEFGKNTLNTVVSGLTKLWTTLTTNPFAVVIAIVVGLIATFITAYNTSEEFRNKVDALWETIKANLIPIFKETVRILSELWEQIKTNLSPYLEILYKLFLSLWDVLGVLLTTLTDLINRIFTALKPVLEWLMPIIGEIITAVGTGIVLAIGAVITIIDAVIVAITGIVSAVKTVISWVQSAISLFKDLIGIENKYANITPSISGHDYDENKGGGGRVSVLDYYPSSGGLGLNYGIAGGGMGGTINLHTDLIINNNGDPINEASVRRWGKVITDVVSDELGKRI